jgi:hypothetical protein
MSVYYFERLDTAEMRESGGAFSSLEEALRGVESSYRHNPRHHPGEDFRDVLARQDPRFSFRRRQAEGAWLVEVFANPLDQGEPLAVYKIIEGRFVHS